MYKISEFSNITQLSIKALRYYDEEGLLVPSQRNEIRFSTVQFSGNFPQLAI